MPFLLTLLGVAKSVLGFGLSLLKALLDWAGKHPLLALAIAVDVVLLYGCYVGHRYHQRADAEAGQITSLKADNAGLSARLKQYAKALTDAQQALVNTIEQNDKDVERIKRAADEQLVKAQAEAARARKQRDRYVALTGKYKTPGKNCGTAEQRIACEEALTAKFITDYQRIR